METNSNNWTDILIGLLGVYGGLVIVLRLIIPYVIKILSKIIERRTRRRTAQVKSLPALDAEHVSAAQ